MLLKNGRIASCSGTETDVRVKGGKGVVAGQSGFSLIELMIAICILSIGVLAVCSMQISGLNGNAAARQYTDYATLAMERMETLMAMPYSSLPVDGGLAGASGLFVTDDTADKVESNGDYTVYINVAPKEVLPDSTTVAVTVVWRDRGKRRSVSLQGLIPRLIPKA
jgi:prepilin-type N-terminal cleavage/methylation domain-containing protein